MSEFICKRRNKQLPKLMPLDFCIGCEENTPEIFSECMKNMGGFIFIGEETALKVIKGGKHES